MRLCCAVFFLHRLLYYSLLEVWHLAGCYQLPHLQANGKSMSLILNGT